MRTLTLYSCSYIIAILGGGAEHVVGPHPVVLRPDSGLWVQGLLRVGTEETLGVQGLEPG